MKQRKYVVILMFLLVCVSLLVMNPFKEDIWDSNFKLLKNEILSKNATNKKVNLTTFIPFEWDKVYSFVPYFSKETIYEIIGYKWGNISETVSEGMNQIVFMKDGKVVCYLYGYPESNKFGIFFEGKDSIDNVKILYSEDNEVFDVTKNGDIVFLKHSK
ncbi:hypothetical protein [Sporosarcina psychrophila]|uniref:Uncharacterized protein YkuJ n=1 Tax=Sporosarcina psychrophila TaxID=1476 RepID=A0ABV2K766_SPOPS